MVNKLDSNTRLHWETSLADSNAFPTFLTLQTYLENRVRALQAARPEASSTPVSSSSFRSTKTARVSANAATTSKSKACPVCRESHLLPYCRKFKALSVPLRYEQVRKTGVCFNCLRSGHSVESCRSIVVLFAWRNTILCFTGYLQPRLPLRPLKGRIQRKCQLPVPVPSTLPSLQWPVRSDVARY